MKGRNTTIVQNRKARHEFYLEATFTAGLLLTGTEVKSLRTGKASLQEAYCVIEKNEAFIVGMNIAEYENGSYNNHEPTRKRKLLLNKREIAKLRKGLEQQGFTIVPVKLFFNERNLVKLSLALGKGKKLFDKRDTVKKRDVQREIDRSS
ncbi:MAG: SsrA-binding protein SmpB [Bacteroidota bacterium]